VAAIRPLDNFTSPTRATPFTSGSVKNVHYDDTWKKLFTKLALRSSALPPPMGRKTLG